MAIGGDVVETPRAFGPGRLRTIAAVAEALFSDETEQGLVAPSAELVARVSDEFDLWIGSGSSDLGRGYRFVVTLIEWLPFFVTGVFGRTSRLSLARRLAFLERLERWRFSLLGTVVAAFKVPMTMLAFELDPELRITGFDRTTVSTPRTMRRQLPLRVPEGPKVQAR